MPLPNIRVLTATMLPRLPKKRHKRSPTATADGQTSTCKRAGADWTYSSARSTKMPVQDCSTAAAPISSMPHEQPSARQATSTTGDHGACRRALPTAPITTATSGIAASGCTATSTSRRTPRLPCTPHTPHGSAQQPLAPNCATRTSTPPTSATRSTRTDKCPTWTASI